MLNTLQAIADRLLTLARGIRVDPEDTIGKPRLASCWPGRVLCFLGWFSSALGSEVRLQETANRARGEALRAFSIRTARRWRSYPNRSLVMSEALTPNSTMSPPYGRSRMASVSPLMTRSSALRTESTSTPSSKSVMTT